MTEKVSNKVNQCNIAGFRIHLASVAGNSVDLEDEVGERGPE